MGLKGASLLQVFLLLSGKFPDIQSQGQIHFADRNCIRNRSEERCPHWSSARDRQRWISYLYWHDGLIRFRHQHLTRLPCHGIEVSFLLLLLLSHQLLKLTCNFCVSEFFEQCEIRRGKKERFFFRQKASSQFGWSSLHRGINSKWTHDFFVTQ